MLKKKTTPYQQQEQNTHYNKNNNSITGAYWLWPKQLQVEVVTGENENLPLSQQGILSWQNQGFLGNLVPNENCRADRN